jgi:urea transport system permease protein
VNTLGGIFQYTVLSCAYVGAIVLTMVIGFIIERVFMKKLYGKVGEGILVTFGLSYAFQEIVRLFFGPEDQYMPVPIEGSLTFGFITIPDYNIFLIIMAILILIGTLYGLFKTEKGMLIRAIVQNRSMVQCLGINSSKFDSIIFSFGCALAGLAGVLIAPVSSITPSMGMAYIVNSFLVVILGGINSIIGVFFSSAITGEFVTMGAGILSDTTAKIFMLILVIIIIRVRPNGLFSLRDKR